tara:strand:+ start:1877 stop:2446 length:570 start_codon:yes stop_codon:yes gene_type:complete
MSRNPYYWWWTDVLTLKTIKNINKFIVKNYDEVEKKESKATYSDGSLRKNNQTFLIRYEKIKKYIAPLVEECMIRNKGSFGYDIGPLLNKVGCNYNIYDSKNSANYDWHVDYSPNLYEDIKLTVIINLSEEVYEGGDFQIQTTNEIVIPELKKIGSMIMFPSFIRHKVDPVIKGLRKNLTLFLAGPNFK